MSGGRGLGETAALVLATRNRGKREELASLLRDLSVRIVTLDDGLPDAAPVVEDGATFAENALKKARTAASATGMLALADDSGLEVDALDGRPGVRSARFAGEGATDAENNAALLTNLAASGRTPPFGARFRCVLALVDPRTADGRDSWTVEGTCEGIITRLPRGTSGFGYDPHFVVAGTETTLAELDPDAKNAVSHRGSALAAIRPFIARVLGRARG